MTPEQILFGDLGLDALKFVERVCAGLPVFKGLEVLAAMRSGAPFEVRVRLYGTTPPRDPSFMVVQIVDGKVTVLHTTDQAAEGDAG